MRDQLVLGIDLGTSGVLVAVLNEQCDLLFSKAVGYRRGLNDPQDWIVGCTQLVESIPSDYRTRVAAIAVDGTSGTLLACRDDGRPLGDALPYNLACPEHLTTIATLVPHGGPAASASGSVARALRLIQQHPSPLLLRHQADWITGWLMQNWQYGEEGNNLRLGWSLTANKWPDTFQHQPWQDALPEIRPSGTPLGTIAPKLASQLGLPEQVKLIAGTTDANAAVLTADAADDEGITVLGSTLVLKRFTDRPLSSGAGTSTHRVGGRWLAGGASNSGGAVLRQCFPGIDLAELSRQIDPDHDSGFELRPLIGRGERFPVDDSEMDAVLTPRPVSDALYLQALLEGMSRIESEGWAKLTELGAPAPKRLVTLGGGARNPQWRRIRERVLEMPIRSCALPPAAGVARLALDALQQMGEESMVSKGESSAPS